MSRPQPQLTPARQQQLLAFVASLGLDAAAVGAPAAEGLCLIDEALSHSSAGLALNHERLEFLGDAVLRLAASEFLRHEQPQLPVGRHAALRAQLVSDRWLAQLAEQCQLARVWHLGAMAAGDAAGRATLLAETAEALIGAIYLAWGGPRGGLEPVQVWLAPHWRTSLSLYLADPDLHNWKSALQEWSQGQGLGLPHYSCSETSQRHGDPERFSCRVMVSTGAGAAPAAALTGEGKGPSRRAAEQAAAAAALEQLRRAPAA